MQKRVSIKTISSTVVLCMEKNAYLIDTHCGGHNNSGGYPRCFECFRSDRMHRHPIGQAKLCQNSSWEVTAGPHDGLPVPKLIFWQAFLLVITAMYQGISLMLFLSFILCVCICWCAVILEAFQPGTKPIQRSGRSTARQPRKWRRTLARLFTQKLQLLQQLGWLSFVSCIYLCACCVLIQVWRCHTRCAYYLCYFTCVFSSVIYLLMLCICSKTWLLKFSIQSS